MNASRIKLLLTFAAALLLAFVNEASALERPGFENVAEWKRAVADVVDKEDEARLREILAVAKGRLDGFYSQNYGDHLTRIVTAKPRLFLRVADSYFDHDLSPVLRFLVSESEGYPPKIKKSLESVKSSEEEYPIARRVLDAAAAKEKRLGK